MMDHFEDTNDVEVPWMRRRKVKWPTMKIPIILNKTKLTLEWKWVTFIPKAVAFCWLLISSITYSASMPGSIGLHWIWLTTPESITDSSKTKTTWTGKSFFKEGCATIGPDYKTWTSMSNRSRTTGNQVYFGWHQYPLLYGNNISRCGISSMLQYTVLTPKTGKSHAAAN
jgi:hypothetical protein